MYSKCSNFELFICLQNGNLERENESVVLGKRASRDREQKKWRLDYIKNVFFSLHSAAFVKNIIFHLRRMI